LIENGAEQQFVIPGCRSALAFVHVNCWSEYGGTAYRRTTVCRGRRIIGYLHAIDSSPATGFADAQTKSGISPAPAKQTTAAPHSPLRAPPADKDPRAKKGEVPARFSAAFDEKNAAVGAEIPREVSPPLVWFPICVHLRIVFDKK
jgi:hypothetical protein